MTGPRRLAGWLALVALLLQAALPLAARATSATPWAEVCSAQGSRWVRVDDGGAGAPAPAEAGAHCLDCLLPVAGQPPRAGLALPLPDAGAVVRAAPGPRRAPTLLRAVGQPRAPPAAPRFA